MKGPFLLDDDDVPQEIGFVPTSAGFLLHLLLGCPQNVVKFSESRYDRRQSAIAQAYGYHAAQSFLCPFHSRESFEPFDDPVPMMIMSLAVLGDSFPLFLREEVWRELIRMSVPLDVLTPLFEFR